MENEILLNKIKQHDLDSVITWFDERKVKYYRIGWSYLYNRFDIEDVFQSTIIKVYENINQLKDDKHFETWVTSIFINECKKILRDRKRTVDVDNMEDAEIYEETFNPEVKEYLQSIDVTYREVIILKFIFGYSQEDISKVLDIPVGTVKSRIYRGIQLLRETLREEAIR